MLVDRNVTCAASRAQSQWPALLQAVAETTASTGKEDLKAVRRVCHCKEVGLQEWPLAGRATIVVFYTVSSCSIRYRSPHLYGIVLYGIVLRMSLRRRTILSKSLQAPARVDLTIYIFRMVDRTVQVFVLFGKR